MLHLSLVLLLEAAADLLQGLLPDACQGGADVLVEVGIRKLGLVDLRKDRHDLRQVLSRCDQWMASRHHAEQQRMSLLARLLVIPQWQVREPHGPDCARMVPELGLVMLADLAQSADACIHGQGCLLGVGLHRLSPSVPLALLLQHAVNLRGSSRRHLLKDGMPRSIAYGAGGVLPHCGRLVAHALQCQCHEAVPIRHTLQAKAVDDVVRDVEGQTPATVGGLLLEELLHKLHVGLQSHLRKLVGAGSHQRPSNVRQRKAHGLRCGLDAQGVVV
mmetsp:Transcript_43607/g.130273  ORF Transcript_43607/g.130273 Transcript_43607/m.130273 type:complete len:274 (-) Transcript_43607:630-1451(-)